MDLITLDTAASLSGLSKRTLWRRIADGQLRSAGAAAERTLVALDDVLALSPLRVVPAERALVREADAGDPAAQCALGLLFLAQRVPGEALRWLELAAARFYPEAMYWLGRCLIAGQGAPADETLGAGWLRKAAARGHAGAQQALPVVDDPARAAQGLDAALDAVERQRVLAALDDSARG